MTRSLDWHHECYLYNPHPEDGKAIGWIWFCPDGDYCFYLNKDFKWGYLRHPNSFVYLNQH
ncbi:DUF2716 domain-containing protein [Brevibacillus sp. HB1.4B]|uniref:DUF2716 domain-containing protein n=1 Tax=Brevibacillus sp. HB1.4B TaxID=2738845 RepID=UPI0020C48FB1|nr:DUF2716 domain-containing protein [Brevibacillus sp. HB1.4B]